MLDHLSLLVRDLPRSTRFYTAALAPLGAVVGYSDENTAGLGLPDAPQLWLAPAKEVQPLHLAFRAKNREQVRQFYAAAIAAGARDNGEPGLRPHYHPNYYGAFVLDPDGHNIEAVCHSPE
ncbi:VOC family protein [Nannocystis sp. SCPEA4]|uniref:VOC family protein n=1 Tax=Nannocystis sp. SCPEA4 TaxID=2996787 RepID=UPI00226DDF06|nr:VOC family protein [Nannocystis sp. SCPEA4]MCY1060455.1 VOC family protein [Nannocystis sp. SCPEA4]